MTGLYIPLRSRARNLEVEDFGKHGYPIEDLTHTSRGDLVSLTHSKIKIWDRNGTGKKDKFNYKETDSYNIAVLSNDHIALTQRIGNSYVDVIWDPINDKIIKHNKYFSHSEYTGPTIALPNALMVRSYVPGFFNNNPTIEIRNLEGNNKKTIEWAHTDKIIALARMPNPNSLVSYSIDGVIKLWDLQNSKEIMRVSCGRLNSKTRDYLRYRHGSSIMTSLANGLIAFAYNNSILFWDIKSNTILTTTLTGHTGYITAIAVLPKGLLASSSTDKTIRIWDTNLKKEIMTLPKAHKFDVRALTVINGDLISGGTEGTIKIWKLFDILDNSETDENKFDKLWSDPIMQLASNRLQVDQVERVFPANLTKVDFSDTFITDELLIAILKHCQKLTQIVYENCGWLTEKGVELINQRCNYPPTAVQQAITPQYWNNITIERDLTYSPPSVREEVNHDTSALLCCLPWKKRNNKIMPS